MIIRSAIVIQYVEKLKYENTATMRMIEEGDWYTASCPAAQLGATGSTPSDALDNLLTMMNYSA